ncbi:TonB-dependent receptor domain-containing protein [Vibrio metschnikovii]|uniref:TonB-dependent receptor domain-containing protein n=1 Tax=Vibrio metschnikovii TaxID=28172 RepID=UPI001C302FA4|nr:TonB-dependent receptor [Vibrio metschnikovii]
MLLTRKTSLAVAIASLCHLPVLAQVESKADEVMVVTASGFEKKLTHAPATISVISRADLEMKRFANLAEALQDQEGIDVFGNTGKTGGLNISIRGMPSEYTLILIDGRRQNVAGNITPNGFGEMSGGVMPPVNAIERIEIVRGPMSTLYGSDAMGGVINIITRKVTDTWNTSITQDYTWQQEREFGDTHKTSLHTSGPLIADTLGLAVRGSFYKRNESNLTAQGADGKELDARGQSKVDNENYTFGTRFDYIAIDDHNLWFDMDLSRQNYDNGTPENRKLSNNDTATNWRGYADELRYENRQFALGHTSQVDLGVWESSVMYNVSETIGRTIPGNPNRPSGIPGKNVKDQRELETTNIVFDTKLNTTIGDDHYLTVGAQYWNASMTDGMVSEDFEQKTWSLFAEDEWLITDALSLTLGGRYDHHDAFGSHFSPRAYAVYSLSPTMTVKGGVSTGYKAPQVNALHSGINGITGQGTQITIGSPDLKPETTRTTEIGFYYNGEQGITTNVTLFHNQFDDKISTGTPLYNCFSSTNPNRPGCVSYGDNWAQDTFSQQTNVDEAYSRGVEFAFAMPLLDTVNFSMNYTFTETEIKEKGKVAGELSDTPKHKASAKVNWAATEQANVWLAVNYRGESRRFNGLVEDLTAANKAMYDAVGDIKAYTLFDLGGAYRINKNFSVNATIYNLFNQDFRKFTAYEFDGDTYYASQYSNLQQSTKGAILEGRRLWISANYTF